MLVPEICGASHLQILLYTFNFTCIVSSDIIPRIIFRKQTFLSASYSPEGMQGDSLIPNYNSHSVFFILSASSTSIGSFTQLQLVTYTWVSVTSSIHLGDTSVFTDVTLIFLA